jgi:hypothetical protein
MLLLKSIKLNQAKILGASAFILCFSTARFSEQNEMDSLHLLIENRVRHDTTKVNSLLTFSGLPLSL